MLSEQTSIPVNPHKFVPENVRVEIGSVVYAHLGVDLKRGVADYPMSFVRSRTRGPTTVEIFDMPEATLSKLVRDAKERRLDASLTKGDKAALRKFARKFGK